MMCFSPHCVLVLLCVSLWGSAMMHHLNVGVIDDAPPSCVHNGSEPQTSGELQASNCCGSILHVPIVCCCSSLLCGLIFCTATSGSSSVIAARSYTVQSAAAASVGSSGAAKEPTAMELQSFVTTSPAAHCIGFPGVLVPIVFFLNSMFLHNIPLPKVIAHYSQLSCMF